ncbi:MAG: transcription termination/antitermination factor NusG [Aeriscardovia sp.]|nr:transcription termination/antitermination factor NusG [Aeriscardovia sp.]MBO6071326.1 transcription termination/antitermination factor NusG [Aeriscardovia sp.]MBO7717569.1 transcription termination/antitermination factor NusG [Aeriscardovia sp.]
MDEKSTEKSEERKGSTKPTFSETVDSGLEDEAKNIGDTAVEDFEDELDSKAEMGFKWYALNTYSGYEKRVKRNIECRTRNYTGDDFHPSEYILDVEVPLEDVEQHTEKGKRNIEGRVRIPGYVLINMKDDKRAINFVQETEGVTSFAEMNHKPVALTRKEVMDMMAPFIRHRAIKEANLKAPDKVVEVKYKVGENVNIITDPFAGFHGTISEVLPEAQKLKVMISAFGRDTPMDLGFDQVEKIEEA